MPTPLENWFHDQPEPQASGFIALRDFILNMDEEVRLLYKWGGPFFYYKNKVFAYLWKDKKTQWPYLAIFEGKLVKHPKLEWGDRKRITALPIDPEADLPIKDIRDIITQALDLYRKGIIKVN